MNHKHTYKPRDGSEYKFCRCGRRRKAVSVGKERKKLMRHAEDLWRAVAHKRDGEGCQIAKVFPELNLRHSNQIQVDHFFPRADKNLFFEPANATVLCSVCNYLKSNGSPQSTIINMAVKEIVLRREGKDKFEEMYQINNSRQPNREFHKEYYLAEICRKLALHLAILGSGDDEAAKEDDGK